MSNVKKKKADVLPTSPTEALPSTLTSEQSVLSSQYYCKACGHLFWRIEYPEIEVSQCQKCGGSNLMRVATLEHVKPSPTEIEQIGITEKEELPPALHLPTNFKSQFNCKACGHSFWVSEHRYKVPYCLNCGAPDPIHIITVEQGS